MPISFLMVFTLPIFASHFSERKAVVLTPHAEMVATAILETKPSAAELEAFQKKWPQYFAADPFYNPNLSKRDGTFSIEHLDTPPDRK